MQLAFDPGIGFGKTVVHNLALLRSLASMRVAGRPIVLGVSRKSFLGKVLGSAEMADRAWPTVALTSYGRSHGASVFRVHEVRPNVDAMRMTEAVLNDGMPNAQRRMADGSGTLVSSFGTHHSSLPDPAA